jgi:hypothetical protein
MYLVCIVLAAIIVHSLFETPNTSGGGTAIMLSIIFLAVALRAAIVFCLIRWERRKHHKRP